MSRTVKKPRAKRKTTKQSKADLDRLWQAKQDELFSWTRTNPARS